MTSIGSTIKNFMDERRTARSLRHLSDHILRDIGMPERGNGTSRSAYGL